MDVRLLLVSMLLLVVACQAAGEGGGELEPAFGPCSGYYPVTVDVSPLGLLADDIELPPVSYPVEGYVEPESEPEDDGEDPAPDPNRNRKGKKRSKLEADLAAALPSLNGDDDTDDEDAAIALLLDNTKAKTNKRQAVLDLTAEEHEEVDDAVARARKLSKLTKIEVDSDDDSFIDDSEAGPSTNHGAASSDEEYVQEEDSDDSED